MPPMSDLSERYEDNVPGKFYTNKNCVLCNECFDIAPAHFKMADAGDHIIVHAQPTTAEGDALCQEAMDGCPMDAVGNDGAP